MLACKKAGEAVTATIPPEEAYGAATEQSIYARVAFGPDQDKVKKGREYEIAPGIKVKVLSIDGDKVTVEEPNSNPLGGKTLVYTVTISDVKNPTY
jgi:FKBP-type peptidyl-prolyl cis-trans isomerase 2